MRQSVLLLQSDWSVRCAIIISAHITRGYCMGLGGIIANLASSLATIATIENGLHIRLKLCWLSGKALGFGAVT